MKRFQAGFTLIEIVVVLGILAVLALIVTVEYREIQPRARDTERQNDVSTVANALDRYFLKNGEYPTYTQLSSRTTTPDLIGVHLDTLVAPDSPDVSGSEVSVKPLSWSSGPNVDRYYYWTPGENTWGSFDAGAVRNTFILLSTKEQGGATTYVGVCGRGKNVNTSKQVLNDVSSTALTSRSLSSTNCSNF